MKSIRLSAVIIGAAALVFISSSLTSCNTMKGIGRDIQNLGRGLEKASD